jgi:hypothetical protein
VIQISPHTDNLQSSAPEAIPTQGPAKKEGLGVFAKILAGLLRKAGEKDAKPTPASALAAGEAADSPNLDLAGLSADADSALFPGRTAARGKKSAGTPEPDIAGALRVQGKNKAPADLAGVSPEPGPEGVFAEGPLKGLSRGAKTAEADPGGDVPASKSPRFPLKADPLTAGNGQAAGEGPELSAEIPGSGVPPGITGLSWYETAEHTKTAETGEGRAAGRKKAGTGPLYADSPEEIFSLQSRDGRLWEHNPGLSPGMFKPGGSGEKNRADPQTKLAEARQKEKRRDKITLEVQDFRTGGDQAPGNTVSRGPGADAARPVAGAGDTEILVELRGEAPGRELPQAAEHTWESRAGRNFEDFLARELHQNLNGDIVRHASVALRDGGEGIIRLSLRPESLGNVKIRLEMADNKVTGHIVVESEAALRAFEREVSSLEQAFRDSGFDGANLDMSLDGGMGRGWNGEEPGRSAVPERLAALRYDAAPDLAESSRAAVEDSRGIFTRNGRAAVNMLV